MLHVAQEHIKNAVTGLSNMISKPGYQTFVYYNHFSRQNQWRTDFTQLRENGFQFIILDRGIDLKTQLAVSDDTAKIKEIIETAESEGLSSVLHIGNPKDLYMLPDSWQWRLDYVEHVVGVFWGMPGSIRLAARKHAHGRQPVQSGTLAKRHGAPGKKTGDDEAYRNGIPV